MRRVAAALHRSVHCARNGRGTSRLILLGSRNVYSSVRRNEAVKAASNVGVSRLKVLEIVSFSVALLMKCSMLCGRDATQPELQWQEVRI
jgi:hypothetical protein